MKKNLKSLGLLSLLAISFTSCEKFVEPQTAEIDGDLAGCFELTGEKYKLTSDDGCPEFTVTVRRTEQTVPFTADVVDPLTDDDNDSDDLYLAGFGFTLFDADGKEIEKKKASKADLDDDQVEALLRLKAGEEGQLTIKGKKDTKPAKVALTTTLKFQKTGTITFDGSIGKYGIKNMEIAFDFVKKEIKGKYQYSTSPARAYLWWNGTLDEKELKQGNYVWDVSINETNDNGGWSGNLNGRLILSRDSEKDQYYFTLPGDFTNFRFSTFPTHLKSPVLPELYKKEK